METTTLGTILELCLTVSKADEVLLQIYLFIFRASEINMIKYDHLFQTASRPVTGQGVGLGIVPRLYLNVVI